LKITKILGTNELFEYVIKYNLRLSNFFKEKENYYNPIKYSKIINKSNKDLATDEAIDLLKKMLVFDHNKRLLPKDLIKHKYFD